MMNLEASRRGFVRVAALGTGAVLAGCSGGTGGGALSVITGQSASVIPGYTPSATELARWQTAVGQSFMLAGTEGTLVARLDAVVGETLADVRPSYLRQQPFVASFSTDQRFDPSGDHIYLASNATLGTVQLFLSRAEDVAQRGTLIGIFA